ncbi:MAG TPA: ATP-binding protein [Caulobacteraceae bacterium]
MARRLTIDHAWRITDITAPAAAWFGARDPDTMIGLDARKLLPRQSPSFVAIETCLATGQAGSTTTASSFHPGSCVESRFEPHDDGVRVSFWVTGERAPRRSRKPAGKRGVAPPRAPEPEPFEFTLDHNWRILSITRSAAAWCGSAPEDLIGRNGREVNPAATELLGEAIQAALDEGKTSHIEHPSTHVPGRQVRIEVAPRGRAARVRFEDITAPPSVEELGGLGSALGAAEIVLLDRQGIIVAANASWRASVVAHGIEIADAGIGARYADVGKAAVKDLDADEFTGRLEALLSGRLEQIEDTFTIDSALGRELRQVRITPLRIGGHTYFTAIHEDLSERARILATLRETSDQLLHAQETERQRIAIELHDSMSQHLVGLGMGLAQLRRRMTQDQVAQALIEDMARLTQQAIRETRVMSYLMNASDDQRDGLEISLRRLVEGFGRRTGLVATFRARGDFEALGAEAQHAIFRVTQEALSNVHRHAGATRVTVNLAAEPDALSLRIADDGRGILTASGQGALESLMGVGISGMRARMEQLGGSLKLTGGARGAIVRAAVPLRRPRPHAAE